MTKNPVYRLGFGLMTLGFRFHARPLYVVGATLCNLRLARGGAP